MYPRVPLKVVGLNYLKFPVWKCNTPLCCNSFTYKVLKDDSNAPTEFPESSFSLSDDGTKLRLSVDSSTIGPTDFWLEAESNCGYKKMSDKFVVTVYVSPENMYVPNFAPVFTENIEDLLIDLSQPSIDKDGEVTNKPEVVLPEIYEDIDDIEDVTIEIEGFDKKFMEYNEDKKILYIDKSKLQSMVERDYRLKIKLTDT